jgi:hypothetical protein
MYLLDSLLIIDESLREQQLRILLFAKRITVFVQWWGYLKNKKNVPQSLLKNKTKQNKKHCSLSQKTFFQGYVEHSI